MNKAIYTIITLLVFLGCNDSIKIDQETMTQIDQLRTLKEKEAFLTKIFDDDQSVRGTNLELLKLSHGANSKEYTDYVNNQINTDLKNLNKVEYYLSKFDHPSKSDSMNYKAMSAIWAVIQHSDDDARERNFEKLYEAQLKGDFDLSWILSRMYQMRKRKKFKMPNNPKYSNEIDQLIFELGLEDKKNKVVQNFSN